MGALRTTFNWERMGWTAKLDKWWNQDGMSAREIADRLGVSRGAVLGKVHRMGWSGTVKKPARPNTGNRARKTPSKGPDRPPLRKEPGINDLVPLPTDPSYEAAVTLMELKPHHCKWPISGPGMTRYCGCAKVSSSNPYCDTHMGRAFIKHPDMEDA